MKTVTRIVPCEQESLAVDRIQMLIDVFMKAYTDLRSSCAKGDLHIHLSIEDDRESADQDRSDH